jgi:hypothetical protein
MCLSSHCPYQYPNQKSGHGPLFSLSLSISQPEKWPWPSLVSSHYPFLYPQLEKWSWVSLLIIPFYIPNQKSGHGPLFSSLSISKPEKWPWASLLIPFYIQTRKVAMSLASHPFLYPNQKSGHEPLFSSLSISKPDKWPWASLLIITFYIPTRKVVMGLPSHYPFLYPNQKSGHRPLFSLSLSISQPEKWSWASLLIIPFYIITRKVVMGLSWPEKWSWTFCYDTSFPYIHKWPASGCLYQGCIFIIPPCLYQSLFHTCLKMGKYKGEV